MKSSDVTCPGVLVPAFLCEDPLFYQKRISTSNDTYHPTSSIPRHTDNQPQKITHAIHVPKISPPTLSLMPTLLPAPTPCLFSLTRTLPPHQGKHRHCPSSHQRSRQCTFVFLIRAAWMYSPLPPINGAQPLTRSKVKSLALSIIQFHTDTSIFIKATSSTPRHSPKAPP